MLIPNEAGATVAYIAWIGIERSPYPKRFGFKEFGLIDLPFPLRKMSVSPVGTLTSRRDRRSGTTKYELSRGVVAFPSVGDQVLIPTTEQIEAIVGAKDSDKRIRIGSSPMVSNAAIMVDPDKLFGRHLAVLGNTGSGKSCTVAGLIRWSMEAAEKSIQDSGKTDGPNARFIVLDPNGEYARAFADLPERVRIFKPGMSTTHLSCRRGCGTATNGARSRKRSQERSDPSCYKPFEIFARDGLCGNHYTSGSFGRFGYIGLVPLRISPMERVHRTPTMSSY